MNLKKVLNKKVLTDAAALSVGSIAAEIVSGEKVAGQIFKTEEQQKFVPIIPILGGLLLASQTNNMAKFAGYGMLANAGGNVLKSVVPDDTKASLGIGNVMLSGIDNVMLNEVPTAPTLNGFSSSSYDYTSGSAGELNY